MPSVFVIRRFTPLRAALLAFLPLGAFAPHVTAQEEAGDRVVSLPPLMVEEKTKPLAWRYYAVPGLEVISVCEDSTTAAFFRRHHRLEELLGVLVPSRFLAVTALPEAAILFNEETGRAQSQEVVAEMVRKGGGVINSQGVVVSASSRGGGPAGGGSPFGRRGGQFTPPPADQPVRFIPNMRLADSDATVVFAVLRESSESSFTFTTDRVSFMLERRVPALPDWFTEGTVGLYGRAALGDDEIDIDPALWLSPDEANALKRDAERPRALLPVQEMFARRRPAAGTPLSERDFVWRDQCALFVRWAIADKTGARKEALWNFVDRLEREPLTEALFREHFGMDFSEARDLLSDYLPAALSQRITLDSPKSKPLPRVRPRPATLAEVASIRGRWERLEITYVKRRYPNVADKYVDQARRTLLRAYDRGERDPVLLAEMGLTEIDAGNPAGALEFLEAAVRGNVVHPRAQVELARLRYKALVPDSAPSVTFAPAQAESVLAPLLAGRVAAPPLVENFSLLADVWSRSPNPPGPADLAQFVEGVRLFPQVTSFVLRAIFFHVKAGRIDTAIELAETGLRHVRDPAMRVRLESARAELAAMKT